MRKIWTTDPFSQSTTGETEMSDARATRTTRGRTAAAEVAVYMKGVNNSIAREAVRRHKETKSEIYSYCGQV